MPAPLSEADRVNRVLRDKRIRREVLDREIAALEDMARIYRESEELDPWRTTRLRTQEGT